jgi:hypothetical protein
VTAPFTGWGFVYGLNFQTTTAYTAPVAADSLTWVQYVEPINFMDALWGTAFAVPMVLTFWANAAQAGNYGLSICNSGGTRSYVTTFNIPAAATWYKFRITIPGDTTGTWAAGGNQLLVRFGLCVGSTFSTSTLNAWQNGNFVSATGAVNALAVTNANSFEITAVGLMVNPPPNAEPQFKDFVANLIDCQRYFEMSYQQGVKPGTVTNNGCSMAYVGNTAAGVATGGNLQAHFRTTKRGIPNMTFYSTGTGAPNKLRDLLGGVDVNITNSFVGDCASMVWGAMSAPGAINLQCQWTADADF